MQIPLIKLFLFLLFFPSTEILASEFRNGLAIREDKIFMKGKPMIINAVGYSPWRPGQSPGIDSVDIQLIERDFSLIKKAGFNTIRTWEALTKEQLTLALKYDLWVIQGIWLDPAGDFSDKKYQERSLDKIDRVIRDTKSFPNILMYMVMTEPKQWSVIYSGTQNVENFFRSVVKQIKVLDNLPVSMDSWIPIGFLDHSMWDIISINAFSFVPTSINKSIGFKKYLAVMKRDIAKKRPLFIAETGGHSVSAVSINDIGFGGNSTREQSIKNQQNVKDVLNAGAIGSAMVSWLDTWHYPSNPFKHDEHPWEWNGILAFQDIEDNLGNLRPIYYDLSKFYQSIDGNIVLDNIPKDFDVAIEIGFNNGKLNLVGVVSINGKELINQEIKLGILLPEGWYDENYILITDNKGRFQLQKDPPKMMSQKAVISIGFKQRGDEYAKIIYSDILKEEHNTEKVFYIYKDENYPGNHFYPSGWIGDRKSLSLDQSWKGNCYEGETCIQIKYKPVKKAQGHWAGIYWLSTLNNWDNKKESINLNGYKNLVLWIRGETGFEKVSSISIGGQAPNSSFTRIPRIDLTKQWQYIEIPLEGKDLRDILYGLGITFTAAENQNEVKIYVDNVYFK